MQRLLSYTSGEIGLANVGPRTPVLEMLNISTNFTYRWMLLSSCLFEGDYVPYMVRRGKRAERKNKAKNSMRHIHRGPNHSNLHDEGNPCSAP
jgi:hypothetical protein